MSLDQFSDMSNLDSESADTRSSNSDDGYSWDCNWHIRPEGYWEGVDERFFGEGTPNQPPMMAVPEKLAAEMHLIDDSDVVKEVGEWWDVYEADKYNEVIKVVFNDLSTWHTPVRPWDKDYARTREHTIKEYLPEIIRWEAILDGENPDKAVENWDKPWEESDPEWFEDITDTEFSEEHRKWLNENADWMPYIDREVQSNDEEVELDLDDDEDWTDDW